MIRAMKQISRLLSFAAAAAMCFSACSPEELKNGEVNVSKFVTVHFGTENTDPASTKATLTPNAGESAFQAAWENGDTIAIKYTYVAANIPDIVKGTWDASTSKFSAEIQDLTEGEEVLEMKYQASYPYSKDGYVDFGSVRTQTGAAYNSIYDLMVAEPVTVTAKPGLDESGNAIVFPMQRQTAIAYFHFTSDNTEAITKATLKVEGEGAAIAAETVLMNPTGMDYETGLSEIVLTTTDQTADNFTLWFNVLPTTYTKMTLTVETATKTFTISNTKGGSYTAGKLYKVKKSGITWTDKPTTIYFYESFNQTTGTGGNDGEWKGSIATNSVIYDNTGWVVSNAKGANQCLKLGTTDKIGSATTPELGIDSQSASLYFKAGAWNSTSENTTINLSVSGSGSISPASVSLVRGQWSEYECTITDADATTKIVFSAVNTSNNRFFIDEVYVYSGPKPAGITLYTVSMSPVEGGTLSATPSEASAGAEVTLTATPNEGYEFKDDWTVKDANEVTVPVNDGTFTMPAANVTVSGTFSKKDYRITKTASEHGYIVAKKGDAEVETAQMGDEITLSANPNEGFEFTSWAVEDSKGAVIDVLDNTFTMPASDVTITATFRSSASYTVSFSVNGNVTTGSYKESEKIEFPADPEISGVTFMGWITNAIKGTQAEAPVFVETSSAVMGTEDLTYYAVFASQGTEIVSETIGQTLAYDTWTYSGSTTNKPSQSYRLFHSGSYIESAEFDLSTLTKVVVYGGTFGGDQYNSLTIGDGTNTWKSVTVSGSSQTGVNTYKDGTTLKGTGKLRITSNSGSASSTGVRISKVVIYVGVYGYTDYCTNVVTLSSVAISGAPSKNEYTVGDAFDPTGLTVTGTYSNGSTAAITEGISWNCTPATFTEAGRHTVSVIATVKSVASAAFGVDVTVKASKLSPPANLKCSEKTENSLTFTWDAVDKASDYQVSTDGGTTYSSTQAATTYTWTGLTANTSYTLYVKAIGDGTNYTDSDAETAKDTTTAGSGSGEGGGEEIQPVEIVINGTVTTSGTVKISTAKGSGSSNPAWTSNELRVYAKNNITVSSTDKAISKIELVFHKQGTKTYIESLTPDSGTLTSGGESTDSTIPVTDTWTSSNATTKTVVFTLGASGQRVLESVKVYF